MPEDHAAAEAMAVAVADFGLDLLAALAIAVVGWLVAGWAGRALRRGLDRAGRLDPTLRPLLASTARYAVLVLAALAALGQLGVQTASLLAAVGAASLAIGLALQGTLTNIAAGLMLLFLRPFQVGDYIDAEGIAGTVEEIGLFTVDLRTFDGVYVSAPNGAIWNRPIKNYSRLPTRRVDVVVGISYGDDVEQALALLRGLLADDPRVLPEPAPEVMVTALADSAVSLTMRCWTQAADFFPLQWDLTKRAKQALEAAGMTIPFPQREVRLHRPEAGTGAAAATG